MTSAFRTRPAGFLAMLWALLFFVPLATPPEATGQRAAYLELVNTDSRAILTALPASNCASTHETSASGPGPEHASRRAAVPRMPPSGSSTAAPPAWGGFLRSLARNRANGARAPPAA